MYRVILEYKKFASFEMTVEARSKDEAKRKAESMARQCAWYDAITNTTVLECVLCGN